MRASPRSLVVATASLALALAGAGRARADSKQECSLAYDQTQTLRDGGKLVEARRQALRCSASTCAAFVVKDCARWLQEIDASLPTVVFTAEDASGADTLAVRLFVDDQLLGEKLDGKAVALDPGEHTLRFEAAGGAVVEQKLVARQGEKNRAVALLPPTPKAPAAIAPLAPPEPTRPEPPARAPTPGTVTPPWGGQRIGAFVVGGVGIAGGIVGAVTGGLMLAKKGVVSASCVSGADGISTCKTAAAVAAGDSAKTLGLVSTLGWGTALAGLGVGTVLFFTAPPARKAGAASARRVSAGVLSASADGAVLGIEGSW